MSAIVGDEKSMGNEEDDNKISTDGDTELQKLFNFLSYQMYLLISFSHLFTCLPPLPFMSFYCLVS